jgi:hypothetical protein
MKWRLAAGRENVDTWTYLQSIPGSLRNIRQDQGCITGLHLERGESYLPLCFFEHYTTQRLLPSHRGVPQYEIAQAKASPSPLPHI